MAEEGRAKVKLELHLENLNLANTFPGTLGYTTSDRVWWTFTSGGVVVVVRNHVFISGTSDECGCKKKPDLNQTDCSSLQEL